MVHDSVRHRHWHIVNTLNNVLLLMLNEYFCSAGRSLVFSGLSWFLIYKMGLIKVPAQNPIVKIKGDNIFKLLRTMPSSCCAYIRNF